MNPARPMMADSDPGFIRKLGGERRPFVSRAPCPALIMRCAVALALHPDKTEIAPRGAERGIALIEQRGCQSRAG